MSEKMSGTGPAPFEAPPTSLGGILRKIGPGLILAGSIVGSGELIATTKTGAEAGFTLLWLIIFGCLVKVFVQIELGRFAIANAQTTLAALDSVPGPRMDLILGRQRVSGNWITWFWLLMFLATIGQLGGIVGSVGQAMAISLPLTEEGRRYNQIAEERVTLKITRAEIGLIDAREKQEGSLTEEHRQLRERLKLDLVELTERVKRHDAQAKAAGDLAAAHSKLKALAATAVAAEREGLSQSVAALEKQVAELGRPPAPLDEKVWALILGIATTVVLTVGRYKLIERVSIVMVGAFTFITLGNVLALQTKANWAVTFSDLRDGLSLSLPAPPEGSKATPLATALAAFGIIGVGASELMAYPYWCLEKGYARCTGAYDGSDAWFARAKGWLRVMKWDAWCAMVLYTVATIAFYLLGAAILHRARLVPDDNELVRTLTKMYGPVFGDYAPVLFLVGAFAVLYSTYFSASAANARQAADVIPAFGIAPLSDAARRNWVRFFSGFFPMLCVLIIWVYPKPVTLIFLSGVMQALLLPMLGCAALYFRYQRCDRRLQPTPIWDLMLWLSFLSFLVIGLYLTYVKLFT